jgi:hypothetical protein
VVLLLFALEGFAIWRSDDTPGALVFGLQDDESKEMLHQIVSPEARARLGEFLTHTVSGQFTHGALRIIKHAGGWLELQLLTWRDPDPVAFVPESLSEKVLEAVQPVLTH